MPSDVLFADNSDAVRPAYMSAVRSLKDLDFVEGKKAQLTLATSKWLEILPVLVNKRLLICRLIHQVTWQSNH